MYDEDHPLGFFQTLDQWPTFEDNEPLLGQMGKLLQTQLLQLVGNQGIGRNARTRSHVEKSSLRL